MRIIAVLLVLTGTSAADTKTDWDGSYVDEDSGGADLCPYQAKNATIVVAHGAFSLPWNIRSVDDKILRLGTIEGTVRPSGVATTKATVVDPLPHDLAAALEQLQDSPAKVAAHAKDMKVKFDRAPDGRSQLTLSTEMCSEHFWADPASAATSAKPASNPTVVMGPKPPPLAAGAPAWDTPYVTTTRGSQDWRCPKFDTNALVVTKGRFSIPYVVTVHAGDVTIGRIDGSIAASGAVKLRAWLSISELPPELADVGETPDQSTLAYLRAFAPTMAFKKDGKMRTAELTAAGCNVWFEGKDTFKQGRSVAPKNLKTGASCTDGIDCKSHVCEVGGRCR